MKHRFFLLLISVAASFSEAAALQEDFTSNPFANGWKTFGETNLFRWNATRGHLEATWDSAKPNSYFYKALNNILTKADDFSLQFDLQMQDIAIGVNPNRPYTFQLAIGLLNLRNATNTNFFRGSGVNPTHGARNIIEFDYFPDSGFGATFAPTMASSNNVFAYSHNYPLELTPGDLFRIKMEYTSANQTLQTTVWRNGEPFGPHPDGHMENLVLTSKPDFRVDTVAIESYNEERQSPPQFAGSLLAHGAVDNFLLTLPPPPVQNFRGFFSNEVWSAEFVGRSNWNYILEISSDFASWQEVTTITNSAGGLIILPDTNHHLLNSKFYRVRAERP